MLKLFACTLFVLSGVGTAFAFEPIPITLSDTMDEIIFDGRWTHETEWKASSLNTYDYEDGAQIILRSAHQDDFIYILLNPITDHSPETLSDFAIVCLDTKNNKSAVTDYDDYCFKVVLEGASTVYRGMGTNETNFEEIPHPEGFVGIGSISDRNDRYTPIPHPSYEFKIPTSLVGRESVYGFFFMVYDDTLSKSYTYPQDLTFDNFAPSPSQWGEIYSPDGSLPEFGWPIVSLVLSLVLIVYLSRMKRLISPGTAR